MKKLYFYNVLALVAIMACSYASGVVETPATIKLKKDINAAYDYVILVGPSENIFDKIRSGDWQKGINEKWNHALTGKYVSTETQKEINNFIKALGNAIISLRLDILSKNQNNEKALKDLEHQVSNAGNLYKDLTDKKLSGVNRDIAAFILLKLQAAVERMRKDYDAKFPNPNADAEKIIQGNKKLSDALQKVEKNMGVDLKTPLLKNIEALKAIVACQKCINNISLLTIGTYQEDLDRLRKLAYAIEKGDIGHLVERNLVRDALDNVNMPGVQKVASGKELTQSAKQPKYVGAKVKSKQL